MIRAGFTVAVLMLAVFNIKLGVDHVRAENVYTGTREVLSRTDPSQAMLVSAFIANMRAHEIYPYDPVFRMQLFRTFALGWLYRAYNVEPAAAERIYAVSASAMPDFPGLLVSRMAYLMTIGPCYRECAIIANRLDAVFPYTIDTRRMIDAWETVEALNLFDD